MCLGPHSVKDRVSKICTRWIFLNSGHFAVKDRERHCYSPLVAGGAVEPVMLILIETLISGSVVSRPLPSFASCGFLSTHRDFFPAVGPSDRKN